MPQFCQITCANTPALSIVCAYKKSFIDALALLSESIDDRIKGGQINRTLQ